MKCVVIDDEPLARKGMELHIEQIAQLELVGSFANALDAKEIIESKAVDLLFLDINMPEISGLDFLKLLEYKPMVVFATAYPQYALDGFEMDVLDYLVKPVRFERFLKAVNKATNQMALLNSKEQLANTIESINEEFIYIKAERKFFKVMLSQILHIEGLKDYVIIHLTDRKILTAMNIKTIASQLPSQHFIRISKSFIINVAHITSFDSYNVYLDKIELPLGSFYKDEFYKNHVEKNLVKRQ
jgi:two-component system, LytTR family, response regulator